MVSLLETEIASQPDVLARLLDHELARIGQIVATLPPFEYVLIAARGSSDHAAVYAQYALAALAGYPVALAAPSLHTLYETPPRMAGALVVGISQSGQSPDITAVLDAARAQGRPTLAITNDGGSPLAQTADAVIELRAGAERSVAATKTYTAQLAIIAALAAHLGGDERRLTELRRLPEHVAATLTGTPPITEVAERYRYMRECVVIGRGFNYATAREVALKLKELTYVMADAYSSADFRHGPIATVEMGLPVLVIAPEGRALEDVLDLVRELRSRGAELLVISNAAEALALARTQLPIPADLPEWLSPVVAVVPGQVLGLRLALAKDLDPDVPRGLRKVTRTL